jgi:hypothetical protein
MKGEMREVHADDLASFQEKSVAIISVEHDQDGAWSRPISTVHVVRG